MMNSRYIVAALACLLQAGAATIACAQSPSLVGLPQATDPTCAAGEYYLSVASGTSKWRKCENGTWSDIGLTSGTGADHLGNHTATQDLDMDNFDVLDPDAVEASIITLESKDTIAEHQTAESINVILETEINDSAKVRAILTDESGTGGNASATYTGNATGTSALTVTASAAYPPSFLLSAPPSWWCVEACAWSDTAGPGAMEAGTGTQCKLPAQIRYEGTTCTPP